MNESQLELIKKRIFQLSEDKSKMVLISLIQKIGGGKKIGVNEFKRSLNLIDNISS